MCYYLEGGKFGLVQDLMKTILSQSVLRLLQPPSLTSQETHPELVLRQVDSFPDPLKIQRRMACCIELDQPVNSHVRDLNLVSEVSAYIN
jgi:hypothetical protein